MKKIMVIPPKPPEPTNYLLHVDDMVKNIEREGKL